MYLKLKAMVTTSCLKIKANFLKSDDEVIHSLLEDLADCLKHFILVQFGLLKH